MAGPLLVADAPHLLYRAFFALPDSITDADGRPVNALLGSVNQMLLVRRALRSRAPSCVLRRRGGRLPHRGLPAPTTRTARRCPTALADQWERAPALYEALGWTVLDTDELEADDLMHSLALAEERGGRHAR